MKLFQGTLYCVHCNRDFAPYNESAGKTHEKNCLFRPAAEEERRLQCKPYRKIECPKVNLHLTEDDIFAQSESPAIQQTRRHKRYLRKAEERKHRITLRAEHSRRAKRAKRHGWEPLNDVRHLGDLQI